MDWKKINLIVLLGSVLTITGCAHKPDIVRDDPLYKQELKAKREYSEDFTPFAQLRANYFTRYFNEGYVRRKITSAAYNADYSGIRESGGGTQLWSPTGAMLGGASWGLGLGLGFSIAESMLTSKEDEPYPFVSGAYLPEQMGNVKITSAEEAHDFMVGYAENQINTVAKKINHEVKCIAGCDEDKTRLYELTPIEGESLGNTFIYKPKNIYVWANMSFVMREIPDDTEHENKRQMLKAFVGKDIRWETSWINGYPIGYLTAKNFDDDGTPTLNQRFYPINAETLWNTRFGRELYRMHFDNPYTFYGGGRRLFYNGNMYLHTTKGITKYIVEKPVYTYSVEDIGEK